MNFILNSVGVITIVFAVLGSLGIGSFTYIYSPDKITCTKDSK